jgi:AraC-like DNA-binding protein
MRFPQPRLLAATQPEEGALRNMEHQFGNPRQVPAISAVASRKWVGRTGRLRAVQAYIENNLEWGDLAPANTARELGISVRQLHLLFGPTGTTFSRYVLSRRLERARLKLALEPGRKILDVAFACGIESSTVFYRAFRDAFGTTPTGYRRSLLGTEPAADGSKNRTPDPDCAVSLPPVRDIHHGAHRTAGRWQRP